MNAEKLINLLKMEKHPAGGYFKVVYTSPDQVNLPARFDEPHPACGTIYYLLNNHNPQPWHRLKQDEIWFYHAGGYADIHIKDEHDQESIQTIGNPIMRSHISYQVVIPATHSFSAKLTDDSDFILVSCVTAPGFADGDSIEN